MPSRTALVFLAAVLLALAGCGGTKKAAGTAATSSSTAATSSSLPPTPRQQVEPATYDATLSRFRGGATGGSGLAVITVHPPRKLCWKFSHLKSIPEPTDARLVWIYPGASGNNGFRLGRHFKTSGCVYVPTTIALLRNLERYPQEWYVSIHTAQFPAGAVRGPA